MKTFDELEINVEGIEEQGKTLCPKCSKTRKKNTEPCLSVNTHTGQYNCWNCGWHGSTKSSAGVKEHYTKRDYVTPNYPLDDLGIHEEVIEYFEKRGISDSTLEANFISSIEDTHSGKILIQFPFLKGDRVVNVKSRDMDKTVFRLVRGAETSFYGIQNLFDDGLLATKKLFITEGEIDALSLYECGFVYSVSVPNGAGVEEEGSRPTTPKMDYLDDPDIHYVLENIDQIILVTDADYKGKRLRDELAKRLDVEKCMFVEYPADCKDINDVLVKYGQEKVIECVLDAQPMIQGLVTVESLNGEAIAYYNEGLSAGLECGIEEFDRLYTLKTQLITLVTGVPEVKKSVFLDNINVGYAIQHGIHTAYFSPETKPVEFHIGRLASIYTGKTLNREDAERMTYQEYQDAIKWVNKHFSFIQPPHSTLPEIVTLAKLSVMKYGTKVIVIDPYSRIRVDSEREDKFIRDMLTDLSEFAQRHDVHIFIVAHPTKTETFGRAKFATQIKNTPLITPYMIKGAAEWYNSSDFILSLWKDVTLEDSPTLVYCLKSKYYHIAQSHKYCELDYNRKNWRLTSHELLIPEEA